MDYLRYQHCKSGKTIRVLSLVNIQQRKNEMLPHLKEVSGNCLICPRTLT